MPKAFTHAPRSASATDNPKDGKVEGWKLVAPPKEVVTPGNLIPLTGCLVPKNLRCCWLHCRNVCAERISISSSSHAVTGQQACRPQLGRLPRRPGVIEPSRQAQAAQAKKTDRTGLNPLIPRTSLKVMKQQERAKTSAEFAATGTKAAGLLLHSCFF